MKALPPGRIALAFLLPPPRCTSAAKAGAQRRFTALYRAKSYPQALAELAPLLAQCRATLDWVEEGRLRNDVAITQQHLGQLVECRSTLAPVLERAKDNEEALRDALPPSDFDNYLPVAKAAWYNAKLCAGGVK